MTTMAMARTRSLTFIVFPPESNSAILMKLVYPHKDFLGQVSFRLAGRRIPSGSVGKLLEVGACHEGFGQILRIFDDCCHDKPCVAIAFFGQIEELLHHGVGAIWRAILAQISWPQLCCDNLE